MRSLNWLSLSDTCPRMSVHLVQASANATVPLGPVRNAPRPEHMRVENADLYEVLAQV